MGEKLLDKISRPYIICALVALCLCIGLLFWYNRLAGLIGAGVFILFAVSILVVRTLLKSWTEHFLEGVENEIEDTLRHSVKNHPLPICVVNSDGILAMTNGKFKDIFPGAQILKTRLEELTGHLPGDFDPDEGGKNIRLDAGGRSYRILSSYLNSDISKSVVLYLLDMTDYDQLRMQYNEEKKCIAYIFVDNYEELLSKSPDDRKPGIAANIETLIRSWAASINASILRLRRDQYYVIFDRKYFKGLSDSRFSLLDDVRMIETDADFPVSLSMGVGIDGDSPSQTEDYALFALDLARGRGGDQAVVKSGRKVTYFGGKVQLIERRNKGKSRVMAHALKQLISQSSQVIIMGHKNPDMDSLGAAVGIFRIAFANGKDAAIVIDEVNQSMADVFEKAERSGSYRFVGSEEAIAMIDRDSLLVVVDTHLPGLVACRELLGQTDRLVVIDHHRKMEGFIDNATLTFMEPNASSTSELIAEIIQYDDDIRKINKLEADLLLAGIFVDTNSFSVKTGSRTFEAASWLRNNGGDSTAVKLLLQNDMEDFRQRAGIIANAEFDEHGIAISRSEWQHENAQIIVAQAADELINIKGIRASFVIGRTSKEVVVSARSLGEINVQVIMERFGGGGHLTMAAAQLTDMTQEEVIQKLKRTIRETDG